MGYLIKPIDMSEETKENLRRQAIEAGLKHAVKFTPSLGKPVKILDKDGKVINIVNMNRAERRRLKVTTVPIQATPKDAVWAQRRPIKKEGAKE